MARRIRWQILIASISSLLVLGLISYLALTTAAIARPLEGGVYVEGVTAPPRLLNPLVSNPALDPTAADIQSLVFEGLMRTGTDGLPEPALAASRPAVDETGTIYTFTLREGVTWHDGTPLTVDDVLFTLRAVQNPGFAGDPAASAVWRNVLVDRAGERQVQVTLPGRAAPFLSLATFPILPAHLLSGLPPEQWSTTEFNRQPIGTGPYRLTELTGTHARLTANDTYHGGRPFLDTINLQFFGSGQEALAALSREEISGLSFLSLSDLGRSTPPREVARHEITLDNYSVLTFNLRVEPLSDQGLRRALALGLDKDRLIEQALNGQATRIDTPILPGWWAADPDVQWYPANPAQAIAALDALDYEAGPDGLRTRDGEPLVLALLTDDASDRVAAAQEIVRQWAEIGVRVEVEQVDSDTLRERLTAHEFTMALHGWQRLGPDPDVTLEQWHSSQANNGFNYAGLQDEQIDGYLTNARQEMNLPARLASYSAFQERWVDLAPSITLYQPRFVYLAPPELGGLGMDETTDGAADISSTQLLITREGRFRNVNDWFIRSAREIRGNLR